MLFRSLHEAGIEVWFDRSELRGGDAWDQNIRRQIKECALFLPIISQTTERRPEGYFRLEWRLADNRTHHMGRTKSFLVPVCIDASVNQSFADVPDSFLAVHWTLLPSGEPNQGFVDNVKTLLSGPTAADAGRTRPSFPVGSRAPRAAHDESGSAVASRSPWLKRALIGTAVVAVLAVLGFVGFLKKAVATAETRIAVLQFEDLSDTPNAATGFAGGLQEEIIRKLGSLAGFTVLPPTSVSQYRDNPKSVFDMARELTTGYFVMGSVTRTADNKLQVTASLMTPSNNSVWDKRYDPVDGADRLAAQATVGTAIAEAVKTALAEQQKTQAAKKPTGSVNPFSTYTEAFNAFGRDRVTAAGLKALEQKLQAVVDDSPDFAAAWDLLGVVHSLTFAQGFDASAERLASARKAIETAVKLDPDLPDTIRSEGIFLAEALRDSGKDRLAARPGRFGTFADLVAFLRANGVEVILVGMPLTHEFADALRAVTPTWDEDRRVASEALEAATGEDLVYVTDFGDWYGPGSAGNINHLSADGAVAFTDQLWGMPEFRDRVIDALAPTEGAGG